MKNSSKSKNSAMKNQSGAEVFPERIRPLIFRKLEELKSRRNRNGDYTLIGGERERGGDAAEKRLLKEYDDDDGNLCEPMAREETNISKGNKYNNKERDKVAKGGGVEKKKDVVKVNADNGKSVETKKENKCDDTNKNHDDDEEEEDKDADEIGRTVGPGSPSFRIYCVEPMKKEEEDKCNDVKDEKHTVSIVHKKTPSDASVESVDSASRSSKEEAKALAMKPNAESDIGTELPTTKSKTQRKKKIMLIKIHMLNPKNISIKNRINPMFSCTGSSDRNKAILSPH